MKYQQTLDLLCQLIRCQPVSADIPAVNRATDTLRRYLDAAGLHTAVETFDGRDVLFAATRPGKQHRLLLNAHLDVVPPSAPGQFEPTVRDGRLYGRGASDCLGNAVAIAQALIQAGPEADAAAFFTADEEIGGSTTAAMFNAGYRHTELAVVCDIADFGLLAVAQKGILVVELTAHGHGGHSATPWCFDNPIATLANALAKLAREWTNPTADDAWHDSCTPCILSAGSANNQIPDTATVTLNCRYTTPGDEQRIAERIRTITGLDDLKLVHHCVPVACDPSAPAIQRLIDALQQAQPNQPIRQIRMDGATDARHLAAAGLPVAIIGVDGEGCHSACESLRLDTLDLAIDTLANFARSCN